MYKIVIVGATGKVGQEALKVLSETNIKFEKVYAVSSDRSINKKVSFGDEALVTVGLDDFDFSQVDIAIFAVSNELAYKYAPIAAAAGCVVIDNSSTFRLDEEVPLIIPEVNIGDIANYRNRNIIANPNCSTIQLVTAIHPLHLHNPIKKVVVSTYQSVSGAGKAAMNELFSQTKSKFTLDEVPAKEFPCKIAFNVIPQIDKFMEDGYTKEEWKMRDETKKIMGGDIIVDATCVRVPVFVGHSEVVHLEFSHEITVEEAYYILSNAPGVSVNDLNQHKDYLTPIDVVGENEVFVSRLRQDPSSKNTLTMWIVSDNLRKGAALNAVQIVQHLVESYY
jgi:aspartate-semialdehyde dehydrogenase